MIQFGFFPFPDDEKDFSFDEGTGLFDVVTAVRRASRATVQQWRTSLEPWSDFVESVRRTWGDSIRTYSLAAIAAGIVSKDDRSASFGDLLDKRLPLVERARCARLKSGVSWWQQVLSEAKDDGSALWVLILLLSWAPGGVIFALRLKLAKVIQQLDDDRWGDLINAVQAVVYSTSSGRQPLNRLDEATVSAIASPRLKALLTLRLSRGLGQRALIELLDQYSGQDRRLGAFLATTGLSAARKEPKTWKHLISFFEKYEMAGLAQDIDSVFGGPEFYFERNDGMPALVAQQVASIQDRLPLAVLEAAEASLSRRTKRASTALGQVSIDEKWFG